MNTETSARLFEEALKYIPGGVNSPVRAMKGVGMPHPLFISRAERSHIWDADGNEFVDFVSSWGPMILGWGHPEVVGRIKEQTDKGTSYGAPTELEVELARMVCEAVPSVEMVRMVNSGTEATMSAVRVGPRRSPGARRSSSSSAATTATRTGSWPRPAAACSRSALPDSPGVTKGTTADTLLVAVQRRADAHRAVRRRGRAASPRSSSSRWPATWASCRRSRASSRPAASCARKHGVRADLRRGHHRLPRGLGRRAGALRRPARPDHARQDHRRRPARGRLRRPPRDHGDGGPARVHLPGRARSRGTRWPWRPARRPCACSPSRARTSASSARRRAPRQGLRAAADAAGRAVTINRVGPMLTMFFCEGPVHSFADAKAADTARLRGLLAAHARGAASTSRRRSSRRR